MGAQAFSPGREWFTTAAAKNAATGQALAEGLRTEMALEFLFSFL